MSGTPVSTSARGNVAVVGSLNMDLVVRAPRLPMPGETLGGHALRAGGRRQGRQPGRRGRPARRAGGDDRLRRRRCLRRPALRGALEAEGIDCAGLATAREGVATGVALIVVDDSEPERDRDRRGRQRRGDAGRHRQA